MHAYIIQFFKLEEYYKLMEIESTQRNLSIVEILKKDKLDLINLAKIIAKLYGMIIINRGSVSNLIEEQFFIENLIYLIIKAIQTY